MVRSTRRWELMPLRMSSLLGHRVTLCFSKFRAGVSLSALQTAGVALWIATPVAFVTSLVFNFLMQRIYTFKATYKGNGSAAKYGTPVVFNILATDGVVLLFTQTEFTNAAGKVVATALTMVWNFFIYKNWIFPAAKLRLRPSRPFPLRLSSRMS